MLELTEQQMQAMEQADTIRVPAIEVASQFRLAADAFRRDLPSLLENRKLHPTEKWVAYHLEKQIAISKDKRKLHLLGQEKQIPDEEYFIYGIDPALLERFRTVNI